MSAWIIPKLLVLIDNNTRSLKFVNELRFPACSSCAVGRAVINIHVATHPGELADEAEADRSATLLDREGDPAVAGQKKPSILGSNVTKETGFVRLLYEVVIVVVVWAGKRSVVLDSEFWRSFCTRSCRRSTRVIGLTAV